MLAIEVKNLSKEFNGLKAVKGISFDVKEGEVFSLLGPNGAGKTTTIKMLATLLKPSGGEAKIFGYDILKQREKVREVIGIVFQEPALDIRLTGKENLDFHARLYGLDSETRKQRIAQVLDLVELSD
ncbi:MAG TPA: ATP-binding cassette domain-containing protein, partial [Candidatus Parcubacteria bacterium]|nr:ATP-binding cassette domain-containing protein [Candidatus Parcubacteria bacterium]